MKRRLIALLARMRLHIPHTKLSSQGALVGNRVVIVVLVIGSLLSGCQKEGSSRIFYASMGDDGTSSVDTVDGAPSSPQQKGEGVIKWVEFTPTVQAMNDALQADIAWETAFPGKPHTTWIEILALYSARNGGSYRQYRSSSVSMLVDKINEGENPSSLTKNKKLYEYYCRAYSAALSGMVGPYTKVTVAADGKETRTQEYGLRVFLPIAKGYSYTDYDDFGAARSYGYRRPHLGHDLLGSVGTPIIAIEGGYIEHLGWNQYGGWRIGIRSFDGKRYYYYAHLRAGHPYTQISEGDIVHAGEVIGYLGMTGYSRKENTNGINVPHLHLGMQLIFEASQIEGWNQIWLDLYQLVRFWGKNASETICSEDGKERVSKVYYEYPEEPD